MDKVGNKFTGMLIVPVPEMEVGLTGIFVNLSETAELFALNIRIIFQIDIAVAFFYVQQVLTLYFSAGIQKIDQGLVEAAQFF